MSSNNAKFKLRLYQLILLAVFFLVWYVLTSPTLLPPMYFDNADKAAFFFGEPQKVLLRIWEWFSSGSIYEHLGVTLVETMLAFAIGTVLGLVIGLWLALSPMASAIFDPYITAANSMPRVILAPIFSIWFGLGIWSKVALGRDAGVLHRVLQCLPGRARSEPGGARQRAHARRKPAAVAAPRVSAERDQLGIRQLA